MIITKKELDSLLSLKNLPDSDDIRYKEIIKQTLANDKFILYLLNNKELEGQEGDGTEYIGKNILPYYLIHPTQHDTQNFICFETSFDELERYNSKMKLQQIIFYIMCDQATLREERTGIARHDLIGAEIIRLFNWSNVFGPEIHVVSNEPSTTDTDFATRTIVFEQRTDNYLAKTSSGVTRSTFKDIYATEPGSGI